MSDIKPPRPVGGSALNLSNVLSQVQNPTDALRQAAQGTKIPGEVIGRNAEGLLEIKTALGVLALHTPQRLAPGTEVILFIQQAGDKPQVVLHAVKESAPQPEQNKHWDQDAVQIALQKLAGVIKPLVPGSSSLATLLPAAPNQSFFSPRPGTSLTGTVLQRQGDILQIATEFGTVELRSQQNVQPGAKILIEAHSDPAIAPKILPFANAAQDDLPASLPPLLAGQLAAGRSTAGPSIAQQSYAEHAQLQSSAQNVRISVHNAADAARAPVNKNIFVSGTVVSTTPQGLPVFKTNLGMIVLQNMFSADIGAEFLLEIENLASPTSSAQAAAPENKLLHSLKQSMEILSSQPRLLENLQGQLDPQNARALQTHLISYLLGVSGGDLRAWLGIRAERGIAEKDPKSVQDLEESFQAESRKAQGGDAPWRQVSLPLYHQGVFQQLHFYFKQNPEEEDGVKAGQRFIIEADLSRLGPLQLDGFVRDTKFDLIFRSQNELAAELQSNIREIFINVIEASGWQGQLSFQKAERFPVLPAAEIAPSPHKGISV